MSSDVSSTAFNRRSDSPVPFTTSASGISEPIRKSSRRMSPGWGLASRSSSAMIVLDPDIVRVSLDPTEGDPPLVIDAHTICPFALSLQLLEAVVPRCPQVVWLSGAIDGAQLASGNVLDVGREPAAAFAVPDACGFLVSKASDHDSPLFRRS